MSSRILGAGSVEYHPLRWDDFPGSAQPGDPGAGLMGTATMVPAAVHRNPPRDIEAQLAAAREEGRCQGEKAGHQRARTELEAVLNSMTRSIAEIAALKPRLRREAEGQLVELALAIARRILRRQITIDPEAVAGLARSALDALNLREVAEIRVHPSQAQIVADSIARMGAPEAVRVFGDPSLEAGAVIIETSHGTLDASVVTQLEEIERGFADLASGGAV